MNMKSILIWIYSIIIFTTPRGLNTSWIAIFLLTTAIVGIVTGFIIDLFLSLRRDLGINKGNVKINTRKNKTFKELQKIMPGIAVLGLACVVGGVVSSQGSKFFESGVVIFVAVFLHNGLGYLLGYGAGKLTGMNTAKKRTISIEVGMQNAGLATNLATTTAQFAVAPESAIICAVSCTWHSISGTLLAGLFAAYDKRKAGKPANKKQAAENVA